MIQVEYARRFLRDFAKLPTVLQEETIEKIELFKDLKNHQQLRVHKLHGALQGKLSFSVSYNHRIVFEWGNNKKSAALITIGDHDVYR